MTDKTDWVTGGNRQPQHHMIVISCHVIRLIIVAGAIDKRFTYGANQKSYR